jgi:hypothetical protein
VHDAEAAGIVEAFGHLGNDVGDPVEGQSNARLHQLLQRLTFKVLHGNVGDVAGHVGVVHGHDVRMVEAAGRFRFTHEARLHLGDRVLGQVRIEGLDRHRALEHGIERAIHGAHGAAADLRCNLVAPDSGNQGTRSRPAADPSCR